MDQSLYRYILKHSPRETVFLCVLAAAALVPYYLSLDIPKNIFNQAILGKDITFPASIAGVSTIFGVSFSQIGYLFVLCGFYLVMVLVNGLLKQYINTYKGRLGERLLRRLRYDLISRILRFPLPHFRKVSQGELIPMITSEVEPLGGYMGDAFAQPLIQAGTLLTIVAFLFIQNPIMGLAAIALYPVQAYFIPKLQRRVNLLGKERVRTVRKLSERIGETVSGIQEIHASGTTNFERADFSDRLGVIYFIRFEIYPAQIVRQISQPAESDGAAAVLFDRRLPGDHRRPDGGRAGGGAPPAGYVLAMEGIAGLLPADAGRQDQVRAGHRAIPPADMLDDALLAPVQDAPPRLEGPIKAAGVTLIDDSRLPVSRQCLLHAAARRETRHRQTAGRGEGAEKRSPSSMARPLSARYAAAAWQGGRPRHDGPAGSVRGRAHPVCGARRLYFQAPCAPARRYGLRRRPITAIEARRLRPRRSVKTLA